MLPIAYLNTRIQWLVPDYILLQLRMSHVPLSKSTLCPVRNQFGFYCYYIYCKHDFLYALFYSYIRVLKSESNEII